MKHKINGLKGLNLKKNQYIFQPQKIINQNLPGWLEVNMV